MKFKLGLVLIVLWIDGKSCKSSLQSELSSKQVESGKMKIFIFLTFCTLVGALKLGRFDEVGSKSKKPLYYLRGLLKDWNRKNANFGDVVVFNIGKISKLSENALKVIPKKNPVTIISPRKCQLMGHRKAAFIVMLLDTFDVVSRFKLTGKFK